MATYNRTFEFWAYTVGHGQLLLRSTKSEECDTRIDIAFKDVVALKLPKVFPTLTIALTTPESVGLSSDALRGRGVWSLTGGLCDGFVAASTMSVHEDAREYYEPSEVYILPP